MKRIALILGGMLIATASPAQNAVYTMSVIQVPPDKVGSGEGKVTHAQAKQLLLSKDVQIAKEVNLPGANTSLFSAKLTSKEADAIRNDLHYEVDRRDAIEPVPIISESGDISTRAAAHWPQGVTCDTLVGGTLTNKRVPVLYIVDSGVQPFVNVSGGTWVWHPQFQTAISAGNLTIRQGRVPQNTVGNWPPDDNTDPFIPTDNVWRSTAVDGGLAISASLPMPCPVVQLPFLDPYKDGIGHGTKITSTAIGATAGVTGHFPNIKYELESIRIYKDIIDPANVDASHIDDAITGINLAIQAHDARKFNGMPEPASVLLFASRTQSNVVNELLERALYRAWLKGMFVVVAGGNTNNATSPNSFWFDAAPSGTNSPARYDWITANQSPTNVAMWNASTTGLPIPSSGYLLIVGGSSASEASPGAGAWGGSPLFSRGPDIDILAPCMLVPCARTMLGAANPPFAVTDCLEQASGTSLSAGYVAGAALVYLAAHGDSATTPTPADVRNWFLPSGGPGTTTPIDISAATIANGSHFPTPSNYTKVPKLRIKTTTAW